jgi:hypothetical protein
VVVVLSYLRSLGVSQTHPVLQWGRLSVHAAYHHHGPLLWLLPTVTAPAMFIPSPSLRYASVAVVWSLVVASSLQVVMKPLCVVP